MDYERWHHLEYHQGLSVAHWRRQPLEGSGKTSADAGMGSCLDIPEDLYRLYSQSMGSSWNFTQWVRGGRYLYNEGSLYREPVPISNLEYRSRGGNPEWWHPINDGPESTAFEFDGRQVSVDEVTRIAEVIRDSADPITLRVLDAYVQHGSVRNAARHLGVRHSTFHDALKRARSAARHIISDVCPSPDTGS